MLSVFPSLHSKYELLNMIFIVSSKYNKYAKMIVLDDVLSSATYQASTTAVKRNPVIMLAFSPFTRLTISNID